LEVWVAWSDKKYWALFIIECLIETFAAFEVFIESRQNLSY